MGEGEESEQGKEIEINEERHVGEQPGELPEQVKMTIKDKGEDEVVGSSDGGRITKGTTPPPHARVEINHSLDEENPWS